MQNKNYQRKNPRGNSTHQEMSQAWAKFMEAYPKSQQQEEAPPESKVIGRGGKRSSKLHTGKSNRNDNQIEGSDTK